MEIYALIRQWFDWSFENPEKITPNHSALYFFILEHSNRLGWKEKFGLPTTMAKDAIGIKSYNTYIKTLRDLVDWGFVNMLQVSKNQYSSNIIALSKNNKAHNKALDKALIKHTSKQRQSTSESIDSIDIPIYKDTSLPINNDIPSKEEFVYFSDNIKLKTSEDEQLEIDIGPDMKTECYKFLSDYKKEKSYKTKSDYLTIKRWVIDAVQKKKSNNNANTGGANNTGRKLNKHEAGIAGALADLKDELNSRGIQNL